MKSITMTYVEVLEKMLERKQAEMKAISNEVTGLTDNFSKRRYIELNAEIKILETCLDLANAMFNEDEKK